LICLYEIVSIINVHMHVCLLPNFVDKFADLILVYVIVVDLF